MEAINILSKQRNLVLSEEPNSDLRLGDIEGGLMLNLGVTDGVLSLGKIREFASDWNGEFSAIRRSPSSISVRHKNTTIQKKWRKKNQMLSSD